MPEVLIIDADARFTRELIRPVRFENADYVIKNMKITPEQFAKRWPRRVISVPGSGEKKFGVSFNSWHHILTKSVIMEMTTMDK